MKALDLPPVWLVGFLLLAWGLARLTPGLNTQYAWQGPLALVLFGAAVVLMALAVWQMWRARTTVMPRNVPSALVTSGIFRLSRNPIYLGDALVLAAAVIWWGSSLGLLIVAAFVWFIQDRFIAGEEATIRAEFAADFDTWAQKTRSWL